MPGVAQNLTAMLDDRYTKASYSDISSREDAPIEDALALMIREKLTGMVPPASGQKIVDVWRGWIEDRAGGQLEHLDRLVNDQKAFARTIHDLLSALDMGDELAGYLDDE